MSWGENWGGAWGTETTSVVIIGDISKYVGFFNQNYLTPDIYKSTLTYPLTQGQEIIYTDGTPFYPEDDAFWAPYNDGHVIFTVTQQPSGGQGSDNGLGFGTLEYKFSFSF